MSFATLVGELTDDEMIRLQRLAREARWRAVRRYFTCEVTEFWERCHRAFFVLLPPRSAIERHSDAAIRDVTHHLVLQTNPKALNGWLEDGQERITHLEAGHRYIVEREPVHWATNDGVTDRIHLLVEYGC